jgi:hypothetical protein
LPGLGESPVSLHAPRGVVSEKFMAGLDAVGVGRRANFKRVLFQRQFTDKLHDAIFDDIGFNADP